jgi:hypothetical protein
MAEELLLELIDSSKLSSTSFNPVDYMDLSSTIKTQLEPLSKVADIKAPLVKLEGMLRRVMGIDIDRVTGEVLLPDQEKWKRVDCLRFESGEILFHKYTGRIGRVGLANFQGVGSNHYVSIKPKQIDPSYLLIALRDRSAMRQLPIRESTFREGIHRTDLEKLKIPRLGLIEDEIAEFVEDIFDVSWTAEEFQFSIRIDNLVRQFVLSGQ